jgi:hypothetical protein
MVAYSLLYAVEETLSVSSQLIKKYEKPNSVRVLHQLGSRLNIIFSFGIHVDVVTASHALRSDLFEEITR